MGTVGTEGWWKWRKRKVKLVNVEIRKGTRQLAEKGDKSRECKKGENE